MKKLTILSLLAMCTLKFNAIAQSDTSKCKWGFSQFKGSYQPYAKVTPLSNGCKRIIAYNQTIPQLYSVALRINIKHIIMNVKQPEKLSLKYCYELIAPPNLIDKMFVIMGQHLQYQFPEYTGKIEKRKGTSFLIINDSESGILLSGTTKNTKDYTY